MVRRTCTLWIALALACLTCVASAQQKKKEITDPAEAKADPDFAIQGEYTGQGVGAQVIALGDGKFDVVLYQGGLPGAGWKPGDVKAAFQGQSDGDATRLSGGDFLGKIVGGAMTVTDKKNQKDYQLKRTERKSPTLGQKPPAGAVVLFDGTAAGAENWGHGKLTPDNCLESEATTKQKFGNYTCHIEFRLSWMPAARGQGRSNSGVYVHDCYELQVLDSFGLKGENNECGGFYSIKAPDVNMCLPPMQWQTYDIDFTAPKYDGQTKVANSRITLRHNGVVIHDNLELPKGTPGRLPEGPAPRSLYLQGHGNRVYYGNIWLVEKKDDK